MDNSKSARGSGLNGAMGADWIRRTALMLLASATVAAQAQSPDGAKRDVSALEEVVVTAQRRSERLLDTPQSIAVISESDIREQGLRAWEDFSLKVPGINGPTQDRVPVFGKQAFFMRGLGSTGDIAGSGTASIYVDEMPVGLDSPARLLDVARIEVLKGPQGTLFGEATMGGAVRIISNQPSFEKVGGSIRTELADYAGGSESSLVEGVLNLPLIDEKLAFRGSAYYERRGGFVDSWPFNYRNRPGVRPPDYLINADANASRAYGAKAALRLNATDALTVTLTAYYDFVRQTGDNGVLTQFLPSEEYVQYRRFEHDLAQKTTAANLLVEYALPFADVVASTTYYKRDFTPVYDGTSLATLLGLVGPTRPGDSSSLVYDIPRRRFSQEVRLVSRGDGPLSYVAGVFYLDTAYKFTLSARAAGASQIVPPVAGLVLPEECYLCPTFDYPTEQKSVFGDVSYAITERFKATVGARWSDLDQSSDRVDRGLPFLVTPASSTKSSANKTVLKAELSFKPVQESLLYASFKQGFRQGFGTVVPPAFCQPQLNALGIPNPSAQVDPDTVDTYEVGGKSSWSIFGAEVRASGAAYHTKWKDVQTGIGLACGFSFTANLGSATVKGAEIEIDAAIDRWTFGASGGWTQSAFDSTGPGRVAGQQVASVPKWQANTYARYAFPIGLSWNAYVGADFQYLTSRRFPVTGLIGGELPIYRNVNLRAGATHGPWELQVFVRNVANNFVPVGQPTNIPGENNRVLLNPPRLIGASLGYSF